MKITFTRCLVFVNARRVNNVDHFDAGKLISQGPISAASEQLDK